MIKEYLEKLKGKKAIEYLIWVVIISIIVIMTINSLWGNNSQKRDVSTIEAPVMKAQTSSETNTSIEKKLAQILSQIQGVGKVSVLLTYESGPESVFARDIKLTRSDTSEKDTGGGVRKVAEAANDSQLVFADEQSGTKRPVVEKQLSSKVEGVIVVADGGENIVVKANIIKAVQAVTGVAGYKVQVFKRGV
jgi:stage III sporulation protein AG